MIPRTKLKSGFMGPEFTIQDGKNKIRVCITQGLDLTIIQKGPKKWVSLSHYSNPGTIFYASLLKFIWINRASIPPKPLRRNRNYDEHAQGGKITGVNVGEISFPFSYQPGRSDETGRVTVKPVFEGGEPQLLFCQENGQISIGIRTAQKMVATIPRMYPMTNAFRHTYTHFFEEAAKHPEQRYNGKQMRLPLNFPIRSKKAKLFKTKPFKRI